MTAPMTLPQMKSIWIDEDEEAEKLYGLQAQQFMGSDDDEQLDVVIVNSDKPVLNNKKNIELPPLPPSAYKNNLKNAAEITTKVSEKKKKKSLLKFFKSKESNGQKSRLKISVPFGFSHISHADARCEFDPVMQEYSQQQQQKPEQDALCHAKAFVTASLPLNSDHKRDKSLSPRSSSRYSPSISSFRHSQISNSRVQSTSTMATSVLNDTPSRSLEKLNNLEKMHLRHKYTKSEDSNVSVSFLKNYQFPTVLENCSLLEFKTPDMSEKQADKFSWETPDNAGALLENMLYEEHNQSNPCTPLTRRKSDSQLIITPLLSEPGEFVDTPRTRKSVDDVLLCYHLSSENGSTRESSEISSSKTSNSVHHEICSKKTVEDSA